MTKFKDQGLKILILGYKTFRRGASFIAKFPESIKQKQDWVRENIQTILKQFKVVSFDNLAISQINMKSELSDEVWNEVLHGGRWSTYNVYRFSGRKNSQ